MNNYEIDEEGLEFIKNFEGIVLCPYLDIALVPTIGVGTTHYNDGRAVSLEDDCISEEEALGLLKYQIDTHYGRAVNHYVRVPITKRQWMALVSFCYNLGTGALRGSTLLRHLNAGHHDRAANEFQKWVHAGGKTVKGLVNRRQKERELFLS